MAQGAECCRAIREDTRPSRRALPAKHRPGTAESPLVESDPLFREGCRELGHTPTKQFAVATDDAFADFVRRQLPADGLRTLQNLMPTPAQHDRIRPGPGEIEHIQFRLTEVGTRNFGYQGKGIITRILAASC